MEVSVSDIVGCLAKVERFVGKSSLYIQCQSQAHLSTPLTGLLLVIQRLSSKIITSEQGVFCMSRFVFIDQLRSPLSAKQMQHACPFQLYFCFLISRQRT